MKKSVIIVLGTLLLVSQGAIIGAEEPVRYYILREDIVLVAKPIPGEENGPLVAEPKPTGEESEPYVPKFEIIINQGDITEAKDIGVLGAIVNPTNFNLDYNGKVGKKLANADPEWSKVSRDNIKKYRVENDFKDGEMRAVITRTFRLAEQEEIYWIINMVVPEEDDREPENMLKKTFNDVLRVAHQHGLTDVVFPQISTDIFSRNQEGKVIITPTKEAKIAIAAVSEFIQQTSESSLRKIYFTSKREDGPVYLLAFKRALGFPLTDEEELEAKHSEEQYIQELEKSRRYTDFIKKMKQGVRAVVILAALFYLVKKYYYSR